LHVLLHFCECVQIRLFVVRILWLIALEIIRQRIHQRRKLLVCGFIVRPAVLHQQLCRLLCDPDVLSSLPEWAGKVHRNLQLPFVGRVFRFDVPPVEPAD
jgi:hypothetical protein